MDDLYLIHHSKVCLGQCLKELKQACEALKITINEKKTRIIKLSHGADFLKGRYKLLPSGKVLRLPGKDTATRMWRKLKKFRKLIDEKKMSFDDVRTSYQSWRGNYKRRFTAYYRVKYMDRVFNKLLVYLAKKDGRVIFHTDLDAMEQVDGVTTPEMTVSEQEWEAAGGLARVIDGEIFLGKTETEKTAEDNAERVRSLKALLADTDYIAAKTAEGSATVGEYAEKIALRQAWKRYGQVCHSGRESLEIP
jgi:hypothetical protein